jgi:P27 family predicted phage terminase small subunit
MAGRKPEPTNLKLLKGNPGKRAIKKDEIEPEIKIPSPPKHLSVIAKIEWRRISRVLYSLKLLSDIDRTALAAYCQSYGRWVEAEKGVKESGLMVKTTNGNIIQSPLVGIANKSMQMMHKFLIEFGMSPAARCKVKVGAEEKRDPLDEYFD